MIPANQSNNPTNQPRGPAKGPVSLIHGQGPEFRTRSIAAPPSAETGQPMAPTHGGNPWQPLNPANQWREPGPQQPNPGREPMAPTHGAEPTQPAEPMAGTRTRTRSGIPGEPLAKGQRGGCSEISRGNFRPGTAKRPGARYLLCTFVLYGFPRADSLSFLLATKTFPQQKDKTNENFQTNRPMVQNSSRNSPQRLQLE